MFWNKVFSRSSQSSMMFAPQWFSPVSASGEVITTDNALNIGIIFSCINIRANKVASMPLQHFKATDNGRIKVTDSAISYLIEHRPTPYLSSYEWKKIISIHRDLYGVAYVHQETDRRGVPIALHPLNSGKVTVMEDANGTKFYIDNTDATNPKAYDEEEIMKFFYFTSDGFTPKSPITVAREQAGIIMKQNKWMGGFYQNGLSGGGFIKVASKLEKGAKDKIRQAFMEANSGDDNIGKVMVLDNGMEFEANEILVKDLQFVESQNMQTKDIARIFGVPMSLLGESGGVTYSNVEQQSLDFILNTIMPSLISVESEANYKMFTKKEVMEGNHLKFNMTAALRSNALDRANFMKIMIESGIMTVNECRRLENLNDVENGDHNLQSLNYVWMEIAEEYQRNKSQGNA